MTLLDIDTEELPPLNSFFYSVTPGITELQENIHFSHNFNDPNLPKSFVWPLSSNTNNLAKLTDSYLNISRPPLNKGPGLYESNTYISLPFHITNLFQKIIDNKIATNTLDGGMQIGANVSSLMPDPFRLVHLNPGCITEVLQLNNNSRSSNPFDDSNRFGKDFKNPFTKLTNNFNKLLKLSGSENSDDNINIFEDYKELIPELNSSKSKMFGKLVDFDDQLYFKDINSITSEKLVVSGCANIVNVLVLDSESNYTKTEQVTTDKPYTPLLEQIAEEPQNGNGTNSTTEQSNNHQGVSAKKRSIKPYQKTFERPLLRFSFKNKYIITSLKTFNLNSTPILVLGLNSGELIVLNLKSLKYKILLSHLKRQIKSEIQLSSNLTNDPVTSLEIMHHHLYHFILIVGTSAGEVYFVNPFSLELSHEYVKTIRDSDHLVTYFKKFDLSPFTRTKDTSEIIGHIKISYKPITAITSTMSMCNTHLATSHNINPLLIAIGSDDGLARLFPLTSTFNCEYGSDFGKRSLFSDVISNYFHSGIRDMQFSPDFKFLAITGNGDLIEMFRLSYYNVNSLLHKNANSNNVSGRRSRSGTVNSTSSTPQPAGFNLFMTPSITSPSTSFDVSSSNHNSDDSHICPPAIKDIKLVCRLKSHTNIISKIKFIGEDSYIDTELENSSNNLLYRLVSFGNDGKVVFWEFDYKALPKIKKSAAEKKLTKKPASESTTQLNQLNLISNSTHRRTPSTNLKLKKLADPNLNLGLSNLVSPISSNVQNMASIFSRNDNNLGDSSSQINTDDHVHDQIKGITALYLSLIELRFKKYYYLLGNDKILNQLSSIIHPIKDDKYVPSLEIPISTIDLSFWFIGGKISNVYVDFKSFFCFGKSGDIIKYVIN